MGVGVDEAGQQRRIGEVLGGDTRRRRDLATDVGADGGDIPLLHR